MNSHFWLKNGLRQVSVFITDLVVDPMGIFMNRKPVFQKTSTRPHNPSSRPTESNSSLCLSNKLAPALAALAMLYTTACGGSSKLAASDAQGTYFPDRAKQSGAVKMCWDVAASPLDQWTTDTLLPALSAKIHEEIYTKTGGAVDPFPAQSAQIPFCQAGSAGSTFSESQIRVSFFPFPSDEAAAADAAGERFSVGVQGVAYPNYCGAIEYRTDPLSNQPRSSRLRMVRSASRDSTCINIYVGVMANMHGRQTEGFMIAAGGNILHELLHAYGMGHEHLHSARTEETCSLHTLSRLYGSEERFSSARSNERNGMREFGPYDPLSQTSYCRPRERTWGDVQLSQGDVETLLHLYKQTPTVAAPLDANQPPATPPQSGDGAGSRAEDGLNEPKQNEPTQPDIEWSLCHSSGPSDFSDGWFTEYTVHRQQSSAATALVRVTARSKKNGSTASWGEHPVSKTSDGKFTLKTAENGEPITLIHRPNGRTPLEIALECT